MKYLGYHLKPSGYTITDWMWIYDQYFRRIAGWEYKCLSMARRMILTQSVLAQLLVYWAHLFIILASIIHKLNRLTTNFIWWGSNERRKFHLSKLSNLSLPKMLGVWGIMDIRKFGLALLCKSIWRGLLWDSMWSRAIRMKYMGNRDISY